MPAQAQRQRKPLRCLPLILQEGRKIVVNGLDWNTCERRLANEEGAVCLQGHLVSEKRKLIVGKWSNKGRESPPVHPQPKSMRAMRQAISVRQVVLLQCRRILRHVPDRTTLDEAKKENDSRAQCGC